MDTPFRIGIARSHDAQRLAEMSRDLIETGLAWRWRPRALFGLLRDPESAVIVARQDRRVVGFAAMSFDWPSGRAHLVLLAVDPAARGRGVGRALVRWLEVVARRGGIARVGLEVRAARADARAFYRRLGYVESGRIAGYYQGREDAVRMFASLRPQHTQRAAE